MFVWAMADVIHVKEHVQRFYDSLTPEEMEIDRKEREKGTWDKIVSVMKSKDPKKAAEDLQKEYDAEKGGEDEGA